MDVSGFHSQNVFGEYFCLTPIRGGGTGERGGERARALKRKIKMQEVTNYAGCLSPME